MKSLFFVAVAFLMSANAFADGRMVWSCSENGYAEAVTITAQFPLSGEYPYLMTINDPAIYSALGFNTAFQSPAQTSSNGFRAIQGEYYPGVDFQLQSGGVKLVKIQSTETGIQTYQNLNWWFNPGECIQQ